MAISNRVAKIVFNITRAHTAHTAHTHHTIVQCTNKRLTFFCSFFLFFHFSSSASCHDWHTNCVHSHKSMKFVSFVCPVVPFNYSLVFGFRWANSAYFACVALTRARAHTQCTFRSWIILMMPFGFRFAGISLSLCLSPFSIRLPLGIRRVCAALDTRWFRIVFGSVVKLKAYKCVCLRRIVCRK